MGWRQDLIDRWGDITDYGINPVAWVRDKLREFMWSQQRAIMESVRDNRYTAVHSAHDLGKSKVAANIISWWIDSHPIGEAFVVSTAPTAAQVSSILWREINKDMTKSGSISDETKNDPTLEYVEPIPGRINRAGYPQWYIGGELVGYGRKPADYEESAFQGIHARYVLIVIDEACGVARHLFDAVDALATNANARVLAIGNPDDPGSHFASICKPDSDWSVIHLDGLRSPNMTKERIIGHKSDGYGYENPRYPLLQALMEVEQIPYSTEQIPENLNEMLISELWVEERIRRWAGFGANAFYEYEWEELKRLVQSRCASSPLFQSKVRGVFPSAGATGVIPLGWVQLAINRWHDLMDDPKSAPSLLAAKPGRKVIGADIGGSGADETAVAIRYGSLIEKIERYRLADTTETANEIAAHMHEPGVMAVVDVIGIGAGVHFELLRQRKENLIQGTSFPFNAAAQSPRKDFIGEFRFRNDRAAAWWNMRQLLDPARGSLLALPDDERLIEELVAVKYEMLVGGVIKIESKDEIRKRLGRSTDTADAVIQAFWVDGGIGAGEAVPWTDDRRGSSVIKYEGYDPFSDRDLFASPGVRGGSYGGTDSALDNWINS